MPDVVLEGMFMINTSPLTTHTTKKDYSQFILRWFVHHLTNGCNEVHVVFDNPGRQPNSPKSFERRRRDDTATLSSDHKSLMHALYHLSGGTALLAGSVREH